MNLPLQTSPKLLTLLAHARDRFKQVFSYQPRWSVVAPGRVNLIGEHTDYNQGLVLPMAIDRFTVLAAAPQPGPPSQCPPWKVWSEVFDELVDVPLTLQQTSSPERIEAERPNNGVTDDRPSAHWSAYLRGVLEEFVQQGVEISPMNVAIVSSIPPGGGLSSSAALEAATLTLAEHVARLHATRPPRLTPRQRVALCQRAEHLYAGVPCGVMDQFASLYGQRDHAMRIDCRDLVMSYVPFQSDQVATLVIDTRIRHSLATSQYAQRRQECQQAAQMLQVQSLRELHQVEAPIDQLPDPLQRRVAHVVGENQRVDQFAIAVSQQQWETAGELMFQSHRSLRDDYEVSCPELDFVVDCCEQWSAFGCLLGARMTGGGFGGCAIALVQLPFVEKVAKQIADAYQEEFGRTPHFFTVQAADGAHLHES